MQRGHHVSRASARDLIRASLCVVAVALAIAATALIGPAGAARRPHNGLAVSSSVVFARINAIRASFGLPLGRRTTRYAAEVVQGVRANEDPPFSPTGGGVVGEDSLWGVIPESYGSGTASPLGVVNAWVFRDGWQGSAQNTWNLDCTSPSASGCNGHRREILSTPPVAGAKLYVDVQTSNVTYAGGPALAVAVLMVWILNPSSGGVGSLASSVPSVSVRVPELALGQSLTA